VSRLGVGSTLGELQRRRSVRVSREEGWWAVVSDASISFDLEAAVGTDGARVTSIWLWLEPRTVREQRCP
jgi:hypothetical protein